jgi:uncharacterized membrane protein YfcA
MAVGLAGGVVAGLAGVGGGVLFVPALVIFLDQTQIEAEATSLVAIAPVAVVGAWRQARFGNVRVADGIWIGLLSPLGVLAGAVVANSLSQRALEVAFAFLVLVVAWRLTLDAFRRGPERPPIGRQSDGAGLEVD